MSQPVHTQDTDSVDDLATLLTDTLAGIHSTGSWHTTCAVDLGYRASIHVPADWRGEKINSYDIGLSAIHTDLHPTLAGALAEGYEALLDAYAANSAGGAA